ncbi:MAG: translation elongation factor Ts [Candidatus Moranbacteria bacterium]|nr:translation elongation factor Ts [bacterium]MDP1833537.1 translation elongation factor Ts [Candidatus Moranbacteria bacterium]
MATLEQIKSLRERTGAGIVEVKKALEEAQGDDQKAIEILRKRGQEKAMKKSDRIAGEGVIVSYVHSNGRVGSIVKLLCETDFVGRNEEFKSLAQDIAMHITAANPKYLKPEDVPAEVVAKEKEIWAAQLASENKPEDIMDTILAGKEKKFREENSLLTQPFIKNPDQTIGGLLTEKISKMGENIQVGEFSRIEL